MYSIREVNLVSFPLDVLGIIVQLCTLDAVASLQRTCKRFNHLITNRKKTDPNIPPTRREVFRWIKDLDFGLVWCNICWYDIDNSRLIYLNMQKSIKFGPTYNYVTHYGVLYDNVVVVVPEKKLECNNCNIVDYLDKLLPANIVVAPNIAATIVTGRRCGKRTLKSILEGIKRIEQDAILLCQTARYKRLMNVWSSFSMRDDNISSTISNRPLDNNSDNNDSENSNSNSEDSNSNSDGDGEVNIEGALTIPITMNMNGTIENLRSFRVRTEKDNIHLINNIDVLRWMLYNLKNRICFRMAFYEKEVTNNDRAVFVLEVDGDGIVVYKAYSLEIIGSGFTKKTSDIRGCVLREEDVPVMYRLDTLLSGRIPNGLDPITRMRVMLSLDNRFNSPMKIKRCLMAFLYPLGATLKFIPEYQKKDAFGRVASWYAKCNCQAEIQLVSLLTHYWCAFGKYRHDGKVPGVGDDRVKREVGNDFKDLVAFLSKNR